MAFKNDIKQLFRPYYIFNIILSLSYVISKQTPGICNYLFEMDECEFSGRETEILFFLIIVVMIRTRKAGNVSMISYLSSSFIYTKIANLILWFNADIVMGIIFGIIFILGALLLPEPTYCGPDNVIYFRELQTLEDELNKDKNTVWLIAFYTIWCRPCADFAPTFAKLSNDYHLSNLKFGKIDVGRYPEAAKKYKIDVSKNTKQLPTMILFEDGKETVRRPIFDSKGNAIRFLFSEENIKSVFNLNNLHKDLKVKSKNNKESHTKSE